MQRDRDLDNWAVFCTVAELGSISAACDRVNMDPSGISRLLRGLETALGGITLFDRSMRPLKLTENGEIAYRYAQVMLENHRALIESLDKDPMAMRGTISIGLPPLLLQNFLLPFLKAFQDDYPEIYLKIIENTSTTPLSFDTEHGRLDVLCGYGSVPSHPNLVQIHYGNGVMLPCASPLYIRRKGFPEHPKELSSHTGVIFASPIRPRVRYLMKGEETEGLLWGNEMLFDSAASAVNAVLYGVGIHPAVPALHCFRELVSQELVNVLPQWRAPGNKLYLYARPEAVRLKRVQVFIERYRAFIDALHEECEKALYPIVGELHLRLPKEW